jgi:hypothetical protein
MKRIFSTVTCGYAKENLPQNAPMDEESPYLCDWTAEKGGYILWLEKDHSVWSFASDFQDAYQSLWLRICDKFGDEGPLLEFTRGTPRDSLMERFRGLEVVTVAGIDYAEGPINFANCYTGALCEYCAEPVGKRNEVPGVYSYVPAGAGALTRKSSYLYSDTFISILTDEERAGLHLRKVELEKKSRSKNIQYELLEPAAIEYVGVKDLGGLQGWRCPECHARWFGNYIRGFPVHKFIATGSLPDPIPSCFVAGNKYDGFVLCMTMKRWKEIAQRPERKGVAYGKLGIVDDTEVERNPLLPIKPPPKSLVSL